jgi:CBS domain containing-hemolysin-like protein
MDIVLVSAGMVALLLLQGFFSGSEIALVHADRIKLHHMANNGSAGAARVLKMFHRPEFLLGTTLVGTNISVVSFTTLGTLLMMHLFGEYGDVVAFILFTPLLLIMGEVVPKSVYQQKAEVLAPRIVYPLQFFATLFYPVVFVFSWVARSVARVTGVEMAHRELFVNREQIRSVIEMTEIGANVDVFDRDRIMRVVRYADVTVGEAMVPFAEMTTLSTDHTTTDAIQLSRQRGHFRLPVYEGEQNQMIGIIAFNMWDLMDPRLRERSLRELITPAHFVTPHQPLDELLPVLQQRKDHMAIVVDEYGSAVGMITLEDILEEIVGEVIDVGYTFDEHVSRAKYKFEKQENGAYLIDGRLPITEACARLEVSLPSSEAHTLGGLVIAHLRHIPKPGEFIVQSGYRITVEAVNERGIQKLRVETA